MYTYNVHVQLILQVLCSRFTMIISQYSYQCTNPTVGQTHIFRTCNDYPWFNLLHVDVYSPTLFHYHNQQN